jgi:hypothetical protein
MVALAAVVVILAPGLEGCATVCPCAAGLDRDRLGV